MTQPNILTGSEFNRLYGHLEFYKFTNKEEIHNGFQFRDGLNVDTVPFYPE